MISSNPAMKPTQSTPAPTGTPESQVLHLQECPALGWTRSYLGWALLGCGLLLALGGAVYYCRRSTTEEEEEEEEVAKDGDAELGTYGASKEEVEKEAGNQGAEERRLPVEEKQTSDSERKDKTSN